MPPDPLGRLDHPQGQPSHPKASSYAPASTAAELCMLYTLYRIAGNFRGVIFYTKYYFRGFRGYYKTTNFLPTNKGCACMISNNRLTNHEFFPQI